MFGTNTSRDAQRKEEQESESSSVTVEKLSEGKLQMFQRPPPNKAPGRTNGGPFDINSLSGCSCTPVCIHLFCIATAEPQGSSTSFFTVPMSFFTVLFSQSGAIQPRSSLSCL